MVWARFTRGPQRSATWLAMAALLCFASAPSVVVAADSPKDLGSVLAANSNLSTYYELVKSYPELLLNRRRTGGLTVIAPNNDAFRKMSNWDPKNASVALGVLLYHALSLTVSVGQLAEGPTYFFPTLLDDTGHTNVTGGQVLSVSKQRGGTTVFTTGLASRSTIVKADEAFDGGLIQVVDAILVPPARLEATALNAYQDLTGFVAALYAADLVPYFAETPSVTIFAPRNAAFQLVAGALDTLSKEDLAAVLRYHLVPGVTASADLQNGTELATGSTGTFAPTKLDITREGNNMYIDRAQILQPDILIANGVVHMIDAVLNPNQATARPNVTLATQSPVFNLTGNTATGSDAAVPYTSYLPCGTACPVLSSAEPTGTASSEANATHSSAHSSSTGPSSSSSKGGAAGPRCTGMSMLTGVGVGLLGLGLGAGIA